MLLRVDKILSDSGVTSRRGAAGLIKSGRVTADGAVVRSASEKYDPDAVTIEVAGERINYNKYIYLMLNKPEGVISATRDDDHSTVIDLLDEKYRRMGLFPAGRLDRDSEGFLILTNDGAFTHHITSPQRRIEKTYQIAVEGELTETDSAAVRAGIQLRDGYLCRPGEMRIKKSGRISEADITVTEGKYHQVKRMLAALGKPVISLRRISIGGVELDGNLAPGEYRDMTEEELARLSEKTSK